MPSLVPLLLLAYAALYAFAFAVPRPLVLLPYKGQAPLRDLPDQEQAYLADDSALDKWLRKEEAIALDKLLANVAPGGRNVRDAAAGSVIASPSKVHPNYYYQWVRDAAITTATLVDLYSVDPATDLASRLAPILDAYTSLSFKIQHTDNPSGTFGDLSGLGEPKFHADGSAFTENWGRPQRDGPALRALTLIEYMKAYNSSHPTLWSSPGGDDWFKSLYNPTLPADSVIKADLEYVSHYWERSGFDVWEEVNGLHFFTLMVALRALREGANVAYAFGDDGAAHWYSFQVSQLEKFLPKFWDEERGHLIATLDSPRSGLDCALLLGSLHGTSAESTEHELYPPYSDEVLLSLLSLTMDQAVRFPINSAIRPPYSHDDARPIPLTGTGIGRYPEDVYDGYGNAPNGGNPWFLCTSSSAQILYATAEHLLKTQKLTVTALGLPFYAALLSPTEAYKSLEANTTYAPGDDVYTETIRRLKEVGDEFMFVVKYHTDSDGSLSEQFDRFTGFERGAADLTWSYGAFLQATWARERLQV